MSPREVAGGSLDPDGPAAEAAADLWWLMLLVGATVFVGFMALLARGLRRSPELDAGDDPDGHQRSLVRRFVVGGGVALPSVVVLVVLAATVAAMQDEPDGTEEPEIEIVGHQWWWEVRYPDAGVVTANELHLPVGRDVTLHLTSADVIHSFWVPALAGKVDLLPDGVNTLVLRADEPGEHASHCAEFCGLQHAHMELVVVAEPAARYAAWLDQRAAPAAAPDGDEVRRGQDLFLDRCASCHTVQGTEADGDAGPDLTHLAGRPDLGAGAVPNTAEGLAGWVADPHDAKPGVNMPAADLSGEELDALVAYLERLE